MLVQWLTPFIPFLRVLLSLFLVGPDTGSWSRFSVRRIRLLLFPWCFINWSDNLPPRRRMWLAGSTRQHPTVGCWYSERLWSCWQELLGDLRPLRVWHLQHLAKHQCEFLPSKDFFCWNTNILSMFMTCKSVTWRETFNLVCVVPLAKVVQHSNISRLFNSSWGTLVESDGLIWLFSESCWSAA